jgi:hypothetical protein
MGDIIDDYYGMLRSRLTRCGNAHEMLERALQLFTVAVLFGYGYATTGRRSFVFGDGQGGIQNAIGLFPATRFQSRLQR